MYAGCNRKRWKVKRKRPVYSAGLMKEICKIKTMITRDFRRE